MAKLLVDVSRYQPAIKVALQKRGKAAIETQALAINPQSTTEIINAFFLSLYETIPNMFGATLRNTIVRSSVQNLFPPFVICRHLDEKCIPIGFIKAFRELEIERSGMLILM